MMGSEDEWSTVLEGHPIFTLSKTVNGPDGQSNASLELSTKTLHDFTEFDPQDDTVAPSGRRQVMLLKDADLIVAAGKEIRMTSLGDSRLNKSTKKSYKALHTPNIEFEIHQLALNPSGKLLAVAGAFQVSVVVLPRTGYQRLVPTTIDCKSIQVGQFIHASSISAPVVKIQWHPWGEAGTTLMVMTSDGKLREYDISVDPDEPQQALSFVPERKSRTFVAEDASEREVVSFTLGKGKADWGPLTVYAVMRSGDVYSICPYMPKNASIPSSYVHALECFVAAKQEFLSQGTSTEGESLSTMYDYQRKYITALLKQLPPGTVFSSSSRSVLMHPPTTIKSQPIRQGPFLLQPSPRTLEGSEGGDATDIVYLAFGNDFDDDNEGETERLGVLMIASQDGKIDVCLDVEKVEAHWESKHDLNRDLPMVAVYETIDLGLVNTLGKDFEPPLLDLLHGNHAVFHIDPIHDDIVYVYHGFGAHALDIGPVLRSLAVALRTDDDQEGTLLQGMLQKSGVTTVRPILTTFSAERKCSNPVIGVCVPNDVYLPYSILILTSAMRISCFPLTILSESSQLHPTDLPHIKYDDSSRLPGTGPPAYVSLLRDKPFAPPAVFSRPGLPMHPRLATPSQKAEFMLTPDMLRYLGNTVEQFTSHIHDVQIAYRETDIRCSLQKQEFSRQQEKTRELIGVISMLRGERFQTMDSRIRAAQEKQKTLLARLDRLLQSLMERASPGLSEHETKWFEELKRMKEEVAGSGRYDRESFVSRIPMLKREFDRILPSLKEMQARESQRLKKAVENNQGLGVSQAFELGQRSNSEHVKITDLEEKVLKLAAKLDLSVGKPPSRTIWKDNELH